ncbi:MAG: PAS domain-containing sensor histidine kinase [Treponema sp.]|jgi:signal transduction histidine kinase|nr:PAS domain-containing sensor histidine kinase [Treponema sp.]
MRQIIPRAIQRIEKLPAEQLHDLFLSMARDIDRLETVLDSLAEGIFVCDTEHNLILANKYSDRLLPMLHYGTDEAARIWNVVRDEKVADFLKAVLVTGDKVRDQEFDVEANGIHRLLSISVFPLVKNYHVCGSLIRVDDITEKRGREARMHRMESLASLTTLAAGVAHEIKNPLGSISIQIQLLQKAMKKNEDLYYISHPEDRPDPNFVNEKGPVLYFTAFHKYLAVINEEIERLNHIVVDFLFAVRPMDINLREADINGFLGGMADFVRYEVENARVALELSLDEDMPLIDFDERLMKQAMLNLIQNAVAAMKDGGTLVLRTERRDNEVAISVCDTGEGIPQENLSKIFEPYFTTKEQGSGLGLTLVFKIVREHQGEIAVKSKEGEGACFTITLPIPQKNRKLLPAGKDYAPVLVEGDIV